MDRVFKGVWIPKEVWLNKELTLQEKVFLVEIDSLDNENGCFASNKHFEEFFGLTKGRCSQIINDLKEKNLISIEYQREGREVVQRIIRVVNKLNRYLENDEKVFNKLNRGIKYIKGGYLENAKDNNTLLNNTSNNNTKYNIEQFDYLWKLYPNKKGKEKALKSFERAIKEGTTLQEIEEGIKNYIEYIKFEKIEPRFIKHGSTWFNSKGWKDDYAVEITTSEKFKNSPALSMFLKKMKEGEFKNE